MVCHYSGGEIDGVGRISGDGYCGHDKLYIMLLVLPALPVCWIETYTLLSYLSMFGVTMATIGMMVMFGMFELGNLNLL